jgi:hypothetical protein
MQNLLLCEWLARRPLGEFSTSRRVLRVPRGPAEPAALIHRQAGSHVLLIVRLVLPNGLPVIEIKANLQRVLNLALAGVLAVVWERVIELIDPKKVVAWATAERDAANLTDQQLETYQTAKASLDEWLASEPDALRAKMGHISSPPGTHYFHGQFIAVTCTKDGDMTTASIATSGREKRALPSATRSTILVASFWGTPMTEIEKLVAAMKKLHEENNALRRQIVDHEQYVIATFREVIMGFAARFNDIDETHRRAVEGLNEVLAGHEVALIGLGAELSPFPSLKARPLLSFPNLRLLTPRMEVEVPPSR